MPSPEPVTLSARPALVVVEGGQPAPLPSHHLCAMLRRAARGLAAPTTPPGAVADMLSRPPTPSIPPGLVGPTKTDPLIKEQ